MRSISEDKVNIEAVVVVRVCCPVVEGLDGALSAPLYLVCFYKDLNSPKREKVNIEARG